MLTLTPRLFSLVPREHNRGVKGGLLSSRLLDHVVFVSRVSQTSDNIRGVKISMVSLRLLDHMFVSRVSQTRENKRGVKVSMLFSRDTNTT
jgi:hypothetical protein